MAKIEYLERQEFRTLGGRTVIGRAPSAGVCLPDPKVSGEHAAITWHGGDEWAAQDLGSRNGTWVNATRLTPGERVRLAPGDVLQIADRRHRFLIVDVAPPRAGAQGEGGRFVEARDGMLLLPDGEQPEMLVFEDVDGRWLAEINDARAGVTDQDVVVVGGARWRLVLPAAQALTEQAVDAALDRPAVALEFAVSRNEEHVEMTLALPDRRAPIPPRTFHYVLLTLARERLRAAAAGDPEAEQGWVYREDLARMVAMTPNALAVALFRARQQLASVGMPGAADLVEVRTLSHEVRLGVAHLSVVTA
ncbi:MAG TPA: FHA domain-containing protein [Myxococcota bacterium]|nr:FHA domain-containing protein [Myxococcota bacterium]